MSLWELRRNRSGGQDDKKIKRRYIMTNLTELQQRVIEQLGYDELDKESAQTLKDIAN